MTRSCASTRTASGCAPRTAIRCGCSLPGFEGNMNVKWLRRLKLDRRPGHDQGRDLEIHDPAQGREGLAVRVSDGGEIRHHASGAGDHAEGPGLLRDLRARLVGQRQHPAGRRVGRRRTKLGAGGFAGPDPAQGAGALPRGRGNGTAGRPCCKAAPPTTPAWCSRRARHFAAERGLRGVYHYNAIASWRIDEKGEATNVYA